MKAARTSTLALVGLVMVLGGCTSNGLPAQLAGADRIEMVDPTGLFDPASERTQVLPAVVAVDEDAEAVTVLYLGGPVCRRNYQSQEPGSISVTYGEDQVSIEIDGQTRGCSTADDMAFAGAVRIFLTEPIDGRKVEVRSVR